MAKLVLSSRARVTVEVVPFEVVVMLIVLLDIDAMVPCTTVMFLPGVVPFGPGVGPAAERAPAALF